MPFLFLPPRWEDALPSTNDALKDALRGPVPPLPGAVLAARRQTRGRGRMDAPWESSPSGDLTFSFYWAGRRTPMEMGTFSMACALAVRDALADAGVVGARCKWPNDVLVDDGKICGILTEGHLRDDGVYQLVAGLGLNVVRAPGRDARLGRSTAAMGDVLAAPPVPEDFLPTVLKRLAEWISTWEEGGFEALRPTLDGCLWGVGRTVSARVPGGGVERGTVEGLGPEGALRLRRDDGTVTPIASVAALEGWEI